MIEGKKILGLICARGGSKGLPRKNLRPLGGIPLIAWAVKTGLSCGIIDRLIVSTEDREITEVAIRFGAECPFIRPLNLATDDAPEWLVWQHALTEIKKREAKLPPYLCVLPPTAPFRKKEDIIGAIERLHNSDADIVVTVTEAHRNPYFNMVEETKAGYVHLCKKPDKKINRRQDAPQVYDLTTVLYAARSNYVLHASGLFDGKVKAYVIPAMRSLDIDGEIDFKFAEFLLKEGLVDFP